MENTAEKIEQEIDMSKKQTENLREQKMQSLKYQMMMRYLSTQVMYKKELNNLNMSTMRKDGRKKKPPELKKRQLMQLLSLWKKIKN